MAAPWCVVLTACMFHPQLFFGHNNVPQTFPDPIRSVRTVQRTVLRLSALAEARANMDALSAIAVATASMGRPDVMSGGVDPQTPKRTDASARRRTSPLSQSATPRTPQLSGSSSSPALLSMPHPIADTPPPQDANNGGGGNGNGSGAALGPVLIHPSKQARELRRAKRTMTLT